MQALSQLSYGPEKLLSGADDENRTRDPFLTKEVRYRLRYISNDLAGAVGFEPTGRFLNTHCLAGSCFGPLSHAPIYQDSFFRSLLQSSLLVRVLPTVS